jgi:hypothetical protein
MTQHDLDSIRCDLAYARRQLRIHKCIDRALDALDRVQLILDSPDIQEFDVETIIAGQPLQVVGEVTPDGSVLYFHDSGDEHQSKKSNSIKLIGPVGPAQWPPRKDPDDDDDSDLGERGDFNESIY